MSGPLLGDLFVEDRGHEEFLLPLCRRLLREAGIEGRLNPRSARGGHGRALEEFGHYQRAIGAGLHPMPDLLVVCIDANCSSFPVMRRKVADALLPGFAERTVIACPDPHVEKWYMADPGGFHRAVGWTPRVGKRKCERGRYKRMLADAVRRGGHPDTLDGIEFAREIVEEMDLPAASRGEPSLGRFLGEFRSRMARASDER